MHLHMRNRRRLVRPAVLGLVLAASAPLAMAQKLVIELKDKVLALGDGKPTQTATATSTERWREQVSQGLQSLGWSARDAANACDNVADLVESTPEISIGELMRAALGSLAKKR